MQNQGQSNGDHSIKTWFKTTIPKKHLMYLTA